MYPFVPYPRTATPTALPGPLAECPTGHAHRLG